MSLNYINVKYFELALPSSDLGIHKDSDYSAKCDICGDSSKNKNAKRLHLYTKSTYDGDVVACFNCGYSSSMYGYLKNYHPDLYSAYVKEMSGTKLGNLSQEVNYLVVKEVTKDNGIFLFDKPKQLQNPNKKVSEYLKSRGFTKEILKDKLSNGFEIYYCEDDISLPGKEDVKLKDYIIIPLKDGDKWYGFYSRSLNTKRFYTYIPDKNSGHKVWNFFNINKNKEVYIFEAIFNALSTNLNSIACMGSDIDSERLKELKKPIFVFDNDKTGYEKAMKYCKLGYDVFIAPDEIEEKDMNDLLKNGWTTEKIDKLITDNIYSGIVAVTKLTLKIG